MGIETGDSKLGAPKNRLFENGACRCRDRRPNRKAPALKILQNCSIFVTRSSHVRHKRSACCVSRSGIRASDNGVRILRKDLPQASRIMNEASSNGNAISNQPPTQCRSARAASKRRLKRAKPPEGDASPIEPRLPGIGTMARTRRLILAAVRVWELKRGIRE